MGAERRSGCASGAGVQGGDAERQAQEGAAAAESSRAGSGAAEDWSFLLRDDQLVLEPKWPNKKVSVPEDNRKIMIVCLE